MQAWINSGTAQGLLPWFTKFNGVIPDKRWIAPVAESFGLHAQLEPVLSAMTPTAEIAILDPATTLRHHDYFSRKAAEAHDQGFYQALVEAKLPFEMLSDQAMTPEGMDRFRVVILANSTCLSDKQAKLLSDYVARGGSVVAAFETGTRTEDNKPRDGMALGKLLGVTPKGPSRGVVKNTYVALNGKHPVNAGFGGAARIIGGTHLIAVDAAKGTEQPFLYVPDFPDLPMEEVYPRETPRGAAVVTREHKGGGRTVYFPWNIGAIFWEVLAQDHQRLIANAVLWALGKRSAVEVSGPGFVDLSVRTDDDAVAVVLNNLTNPMAMKGPIREVFPTGRHTVSIAIPKGRKVGDARLLVAGRKARVSVGKGRAEIYVPGIDTIEVVHLRWQ
jgi:hypothetical protein